MQKIIVIVGPTASGKTKLAVDLARKFNGEIVSADSRQVYRGMNIGTGKDLKEYGALTRPSATLSQRERDTTSITSPSGRGQGEGMPYHLIDIVSPKTNFTLAQYQKLAYRAIEDILRRGKVPILVGGTGLYVQAVVDGYVIPEAPSDPKLRARLAKLPLLALCMKLKKLDPATYRVIDKHNRRRLERAIEICLGTGIPLSKQREKQAPPYKVLMFGIAVPQDTPYKRIDARLKERLKQGMVKEVKRLHAQGISWKRLESFGLEYKWVSYFLRGRVNYETMVRELSGAIKDFSRRQMTWFKRDKRIVWIKKNREALGLLQKFLK